MKTLSLEERVEHGYANSKGVNIHFATLGNKENPPLIMVHGYPDFWYSWRDVMENLSTDYYTVAVDQRGYNLSGKPKGEENYDMNYLVQDITSVIQHLGFKKATIIGHDWGGAVSWMLAMMKPELVERLIILNLPHVRGLMRELATNPNQQKNSQYAREYQKPDAHKLLSSEKLAAIVLRDNPDNEAREKYIEAFDRSDFEAMLNYYKRNYPKEPYINNPSEVIKVKAPVLMIHGLGDWGLLPGALNNTWEWVENDLTLVTIPNAGHFVHHDNPDLVIRCIKMWLKR